MATKKKEIEKNVEQVLETVSASKQALFNGVKHGAGDGSELHRLRKDGKLVKEPRSFKLDPEVYAAVKELAVRENRSVNNLVETILRRSVLEQLN